MLTFAILLVEFRRRHRPVTRTEEGPMVKDTRSSPHGELLVVLKKMLIMGT